MAGSLVRRLGSIAVPVVALALAALLIVLIIDRASASGGAGPTDRIDVTTEPASAAAFMAAFARADEAAAERVASPLYRAEWQSRGLTENNRDLLLPAALDSGPNHEWIHFTYVGGVVDPAGFRHLLYTGQPTGGDGIGCPSVWRVDTAADGRVIWAEMVWIFGTPDPVEPADVARDITAASLPSELAALDPRPLVGVRADRTGETYYLAQATVDGESRVIFFAEDEDGQFRPGAWSFVAISSAPRGIPASPLLSADARVLKAYLRDIG